MRLRLAATALLLSACTTTTQSACDRSCRLGLAQTIAVTGQYPVGARVTQDGNEVVGDIWLRGATGINIHATYAAADDDEAIIAGTGTGPDGTPAVFGLRVRNAATPEVELIVAREGEASLAPPAIPLKRDTRFDDIVPAAQRTPAAQMIAAAEAYFDGIESDIGSAIPIVDTCERVENGVQTTHSPRFTNLACNSMEPFAYITEVRDRRYPIVDEERGVIVGFGAFNIPGGDYKRMVNGQETTRHYDPRSIFLFEAFKVVDGKIVQIEATMRNVPLGAKSGW
jgi:hypothetical protein